MKRVNSWVNCNQAHVSAANKNWWCQNNSPKSGPLHFMPSSSLLQLLNMLTATVAMYFSAPPICANIRWEEFKDTWIRVMWSWWVTCESMQGSVGVMKWLLPLMLLIMKMRYVQPPSKESWMKLNLQLIMAVFERKGKDKVTFSHQQHTKTEVRCIHELEGVVAWLTWFVHRAEIIWWVVESKWPLNIVKDQGFQHLMKTGRPDYYIPLPTMVSWDVKCVFTNIWKHIPKMLQEHEGKLNFTTDVWTSPNHKAFVAVTAHFEVNGEPVFMLLDLVEVVMSYSGVNLEAAFAQILDEFDISNKVSNRFMGKETILTCVPQALGKHVIMCPQITP